jgi:hypothetical protein
VSQLSDWKRAHMCTANHLCFGRIYGSQLREGANAGQHTPTLSLPSSHHCLNGEVYRGNRHYNVCEYQVIDHGTRVPWYYEYTCTMLAWKYTCTYHGTCRMLHTNMSSKTKNDLKYVHGVRTCGSQCTLCALFQSESCDITL